MRRLGIVALIVVVLVIACFIAFHTRPRVDTPQPVQAGQQVQRSVIGIGVLIAARHGAFEIMSVLSNTPAAQAGLRRGLIVQQINGTNVAGKSLKMCVEMIRGPVGSTVQLQVIDPVKSETNIVEFTREKITLPPGHGPARPVTPSPEPAPSAP